MATYYGYRLKFYCTDDGPRAVFQGAANSDMSTWNDISVEYEPDSTADPESVGATVSADGISLPTGSMIASKPSEAQRWVWLLDGSGNIPITIDPTTKGVIVVSTEVSSWTGHDDGAVGFWFGDTAPTLGAGGLAYFIVQTSSPNFNAERSYNDNSFLLFIAAEPDLKYADMIMNYCDSVVTETIVSVYDSSLTLVDTTTTPTDLGIATPAFALLAGHDGTASSTVVVNPVAYLYWSKAAFDVFSSDSTGRQILEDYYNGLLIQDNRIVTSNISKFDSSYTEYERIPGIATVSSGLGNMRLIASGYQDDKIYDFYIKKPGFAVKAGFLFREKNETTYGYFGEESPLVSQRMVAVNTSSECFYPSSVVTKNGRVIVCYGTSSNTIRVNYYDGGQSFSSSGVILSEDSYILEYIDLVAGTSSPCACLLYDENSDCVYLFARIYRESVDSGYPILQIASFVSYDDGETFDLQNLECIERDIDALHFRYDRMVAIWVGRTIMLFISNVYNDGAENYYIASLASHDYGKNFKFIDNSEDDAYDISGSGNVIIYRRATVYDNARIKKIYSVSAWSTIDYEELTNMGAHFGITKKRTGEYTVAFGGSGDEADLYSTTDKWGQNIFMRFDIISDSAFSGYRAAISTNEPTLALTQLSIVEYYGGYILFCKQSGGALENIFYCIFIGNYTNCALPKYMHEFTGSASFVFQGFGEKFLSATTYDGTTNYPFQNPDSSIWSSSGTDTIALNVANLEPYFNISASGSSPGKYYTHAIADGNEVLIDFQVERCDAASTGATSRGCGVEIDYYDGAVVGVNIFLEFYKSGSDYKYKLKDLLGSSTLYTGDFGTDSILKFRIAYNRTYVGFYVSNSVGSNYYGAIKWSLVYQDDNVASSSSGSARFNLSWGIYSASSGNSFNLYYIHYFAKIGDEWDLSAITAINGSETDYRHPIKTSTSPKLLENLFYISWANGPAENGDSYEISPSYTYPIDNIDALKKPSKSLSWKADGETEQLIVYTPEEEAPAAWSSPNLGFYIEKPNFKTAYLQGRTTMAGSWTTLLTLNACEGFEDLAYTTTSAGGLYGPGLRPASDSDSAARPIQDGELVGGYVICDNGVTTIIRPIRHNTEGVWGGSSIVGKKPIIYVDDWDAAHGEGTLSIILPQHLLVLPDFTTDYVQFRIRIPAQDTYEGKLSATKMIVGPVYLFPRAASWGRTVSRRQNYKTTKTQSGQRFSKRMGETQTVMQFAWAEYAGDDLGFLDSSDPDYITLIDGGEPVGFRESLPYLFESLHEQLQGGVRTAVLCLGLPSGTTPIKTNDPKKLLRGPITSEYTRNANLGREVASEYWTINTFEMEEEK